MTPDIPIAPPQESTVATVQQVSAGESATLRVESHGYIYIVSGNTVLTTDRIRSLLDSAVDPKAAVEALNQAYQDAGYFLVSIRGQVQDRQVVITVVQGRVTELDVTPSLLGFFEGVQGDETLTRNDVLRHAALAESYAAREGKRPKASFAPAGDFGGSRLTVTEEDVPDASPWNASLGFGNYGNRYSSRFLAQGAAAWRPGAGLEVNANYSQGLPSLSDESRGSRYQGGGAGISWVTPYGVYGASFSHTLYRIGEAARPLNPEGDILTWSVSGSQLVFADANSRWIFNEGFTRTDYTVTVFDRFFTLTDQKYDFINLGTTYSRSLQVFGKSATLSASASWMNGLSSREGTFVFDGAGSPDPNFTIWQWGLGYTQDLPAGFRFGVNLSGQEASATLPQNQQWVLGGFGNLTAWYPGVLIGDSGVLLRASVAAPSWSWDRIEMNGGMFVEGGSARTHFTLPGQPEVRRLADVGVSLGARWDKHAGATMAVAVPLWRDNIDKRVVDAERVHLYFSLNFDL
ncbi:MAG TPA: ShlB/FhaC/HecB family hemolysin secretion/activation protein [Accumulibacter sp.]|uniref:ShlB/FhaC/HecB family hemolysin secretion/activation protein n=1 Tax=Accumulibacter sp. TaxID=2053492 RepID=UPI002C101BDD|nr:ShlB/FhaC/HecB family hemolysin secretion/activation protein [Accumulibacter sp.]HMW55696.1 ShlB/FhaC/HecB family hemolysin secretion/activation protein [Accumulibacter sp.]